MPSIACAGDGPSDFGWYEGTPLHLGFGIIQNDLNKRFGEQCVDYREEPASQDVGAQITTFDAEVVKDYNSLLNKMGVDTAISVHSLTGGAEAAYREQRESFAEDSSINVLIRAKAVLPDRILKNATLRAPIKKLIDEKNLHDAIARCGSKFVNVEHRGLQLNVILTISNSTAKNRKAIDASLSGHYGSGALGGNAKIAFNSELVAAQKSGRVLIKVSTIGGDPGQLFKGQIEAALKDSPSVEDISKQLAVYAATLSLSMPGVTGYSVASFPEFDVALEDPWIQEKEDRLGRLAELYRSAADRRDALLAVVDDHGVDPRKAAYTETELMYLRQSKQKADDLVSKIIAVHSDCKASKPDQYLSVCTAPDDLVSAIAAIPKVSRLRGPLSELVVAVRTGKKNENSYLSPWGFANVFDSSAIFEAANGISPKDEIIDFSLAPTWLEKGVFLSASQQVPNTQRIAYGISVTSEHLDSVQIDFIADEGEFRSGYLQKVYTAKHAMRANIDSYEFDPSMVMQDKDDWSEGRRRHVFWFASDLGDQSLAPKNCFFHRETLECQKWIVDHGDAIATRDKFLLWTQLSATILNWIENGQAYTGKGRMRILATDRYGGEQSLDILSFQWDVDTSLGIAQVKYSFAGSDKVQRWYITGLNSASKKFPIVFISYKWAVPATTGSSSEIQEWHDKWNELAIKYCSASIKLLDIPPQWVSFVKSEASTDWRVVKVSFSAGVVTLPDTKWSIDLSGVVAVKNPGLFGSDFYSSSEGCDVK